MGHMKKILALTSFVFLLILVIHLSFISSTDEYFAINRTLSNFGRNVASVFFKPSITVAGLQTKYKTDSPASNNQKISVLIVPGHEPDFGGTEFHGVKERDIAV